MRIYALYNVKGGVGKTASAVNLAYCAALAGRRTLVWDLDPQGAASFYFRIKPKIKGGGEKLLKKKARGKLQREIRGSDFEGLDVIPADFSYRNFDLALDGTRKPEKFLVRLLSGLADEYDEVFLDCAPSISLTSESIFTAADVLLLPMIPTPLSVRAVEQLDRHLRRSGPEGLRAWPFLCMVDRRKKLHRAGEELFAETAGDLRRVGPLLESRIPYASAVEQMGLRRAPVGYFAWRSAAARAYRALWQEIADRAEKEAPPHA